MEGVQVFKRHDQSSRLALKKKIATVGFLVDIFLRGAVNFRAVNPFNSVKKKEKKRSQ